MVNNGIMYSVDNPDVLGFSLGLLDVSVFE